MPGALLKQKNRRKEIVLTAAQLLEDLSERFSLNEIPRNMNLIAQLG